MSLLVRLALFRCARCWCAPFIVLDSADGTSPQAANSCGSTPDLAVLEAQDVRKDLTCTVTPDQTESWASISGSMPGIEVSVP